MILNEYITKQAVEYKDVPPLGLEVSIYDISYDHVDEFIENKDVMYKVYFSDRCVEMEGKWVLVNAILLQPLIKRKLTINASQYLVYNEIVDKQIYTINTMIYNEVFEIEGMDKIVFEIADCINMFMELITCKLASYQKTVDIFRLKKTMEIPRLKELSSLDLEEAKNYGVEAVEEQLNKANREAISIINDPSYKDQNHIYGFAKLNVFNNFQLPQAIIGVGGRTDIDETVLPRIIENSYLQGLSSIADFAIDSLAARKAIYYNEKGTATAQYANRKYQLIATAVKRIYPKDCGTQMTVPFYINRKHTKNIIGVNIKDGNRVVELTPENVNDYADRVVDMFLPNTCNHTDGVCRKCGGKLTKYFHENAVIGPISATVAISPITQSVLSVKHLLCVTIIQFELNDEVENINKYFMINNNNIFLSDLNNVKDYVVGFRYNEAARIKDVNVINGSMSNVDNTYFTQITAVSLYNRKTNRLLIDNAKLLARNDIKAYLSVDMLNLIKKYKSEILEVKDEMIWISTKYLQYDQPLMTCPSISTSTLDFVNRVNNLQDSASVRKYHSIAELLRDATELIWEKASPHIFHIATLLKSSQITSFDDFRIPVVTDVNDMHFAEILKVVARRSIGAELAFERFHITSCRPSTFLYEKGVSFYDDFFRATQKDHV